MSYVDLDNMPFDYMIWLYDRQQQFIIDQQQQKEGKIPINTMF